MPNPHVDADDEEHPLFTDAPGGSGDDAPSAAAVGALDGTAAVGVGARQSEHDDSFLRGKEPIGDFLEPDDGDDAT